MLSTSSGWQELNKAVSRIFDTDDESEVQTIF